MNFEVSNAYMIWAMNQFLPDDSPSRRPALVDVIRQFAGEIEVLEWFCQLKQLIQLGHESEILTNLEFLQGDYYVSKLKKIDVKLFGQVVIGMFDWYYQQPSVLESIGLETRAPFPDGYELPQNNFDLLETVYLRGPIYRRV